MKRFLLLLALCCLCQPALAEGRRDRKALFETKVNRLHAQYRACHTDIDCTYIDNACPGYVAVNKQSKDNIAQDLRYLSRTKNCVPAKLGMPPKVACIRDLCEIEGDIPH